MFTFLDYLWSETLQCVSSTKGKGGAIYNKRDILEEKWYDEAPEPVEGWPKNYEYARIKRIGDEPSKDNRFNDIKKWRRPLSEEREYSPKQQKLIDMQTGQSLR